jgi:ParB family chromosome partitioning protein
MTFKDSATQFELVHISMIEPDASHPRQNIDEASLAGLANSISKVGIIHPLIVRPASSAGHYVVIVGERRRLAAMLAGENIVPVVIRDCTVDDALEVQVFENIGLGVRAALAPRDMANAIQTIAGRFETQEEAAQHFARAPTWLNQATAAANLSEQITALLDSGKISSAGAAVQLEKLAKKDGNKAASLMTQIAQLPEGEAVSKKVVDEAFSAVSGRNRKDMGVSEAVPADYAPLSITSAESITPARTRVNPGKMKQVADMLGLSDGDEEALLVRLIDEFLALKRA